MPQTYWTHLIVSWVPVLIIFAAYIPMIRRNMARQSRMIELLTEIRDRLPPVAR